MSVRADAHVHFFQPGYVAALPENCRRVQPDEVTLYQALAQQYNVQQVLAIGYEGESWAAGNNQYLAQLGQRPLLAQTCCLCPQAKSFGHVNVRRMATRAVCRLSIYLFEEQQIAALGQVPDEVWRWLVQHRWLVSVNSRGEHWAAWFPVLECYPELRLLVSHLGLPQAVEQTPTEAMARHQLGAILSLAQFPGVRVKLSGFYALTKPGYGYPHRVAWPYVEALQMAFGSARLLWGSDFSPSLEWLSFPQTFGLFADIPFLDSADIERIEGGNLLLLLAEVAD